MGCWGGVSVGCMYLTSFVDECYDRVEIGRIGVN